jgi:hypothetical protein
MARVVREGIVALSCFIEAIRDAGYRGPGAALAELIDNALEADATAVHIWFLGHKDNLIVVVEDNGTGMPPAVLNLALQFGGSTRFGSRLGVGRYGMGLPAASLSQAQRVDVYSWTSTGNVWWSYLDLAEVRTGEMKSVPQARRRQPMPPATVCGKQRGSIVQWSRCDRLSGLDMPALERALHLELGRVFRHELWAGKRLTLNGQPVAPVDPLCRHSGNNLVGAIPYGPALKFPIDTSDELGVRHSSTVVVQFVEFPVATWHGLSNEEKHRWGISKRAGVSVLRGAREIDAGWFFMGGKRRENYDDWWRCEVQFEPELDELFGVNHTKQGIHPTERLLRLLTPDLERTAHDLNRRVRSAFLALNDGTTSNAAVRRAEARDPLLEPLRNTALPHLHSTGRRRKGIVAGLSYRLNTGELQHDCFFEPRVHRRELVLTFNRQHPFFDEFHRSQVRSGDRQMLELLLLAAARAEIRHAPSERPIVQAFRKRWSTALAAFLA